MLKNNLVYSFGVFKRNRYLNYPNQNRMIFFLVDDYSICDDSGNRIPELDEVIMYKKQLNEQMLKQQY